MFDFEKINNELDSEKAVTIGIQAYYAAEAIGSGQISVEKALSEILSVLSFNFMFIAKIEREHEEYRKAQVEMNEFIEKGVEAEAA